MAQARYTLTTISTKDIKIVERRAEIKKRGYTDEDIFVAGIEALENKEESV